MEEGGGTVTMGVGAAEAIRSSPSGTVIARFDQAVYVRLPAGVVALTVALVPLGPLYVRSSFDLGRLVTGDRFVFPSQWLDHATVWRGELPDPATGLDPAPAGGVGGGVSDGGGFGAALALLAPLSRRSALLAPPLIERWDAATLLDDLADVCRLLGGLGPGLTPSGDDALAGLLLTARMRWPEAEDYLVALAAGVDTHEISRAFLTWAARGQSIEPVHRLLVGGTAATAHSSTGTGATAPTAHTHSGTSTSTSTGTGTGTGATAGVELLAFGHTSGADLALGLSHGLTASWRGVPGAAPPGGG